MSRKQWHFVGIGGIGMSGLARLLLEKGEKVTGSDVRQNAQTLALTDMGAQVALGHDASRIGEDTQVVYSSAVVASNPELARAREMGCTLLHRSELLQQLTTGQKTLAVSGTHGKTTTSALLAWVLLQAGLSPSFSLGGVLAGKETNGGWGIGDYFVLEADESDGSFLRYQPFGAIITNLEADHLDYYGDFGQVITAMNAFMERVESAPHLWYCGDDPALGAMALKGMSYGFEEGNALRGQEYGQQGWRCWFDVEFEGKLYKRVELSLPGRHNALNAMAVWGMALTLGLSEEQIRRGLSSFPGVARRCESKGEAQGVLVLDDYAHHPTEVDCTLRAIRQAVGDRRIWAVFQPHRYTRLQHCLEEFTRAFHAADEVVVTDIYGAGETPLPGVSAEALAEGIARYTHLRVHRVGRQELEAFLLNRLRPLDVAVTMGAGDITAVGGPLVEEIRSRGVSRWKVGLIFGGRSQEHEVSLKSARFVCSSLNPAYFSVKGLAIDQTGRWYVDGEDRAFLQGKRVPQRQETGFPLDKDVWAALEACDLFFPVLHGPYGEDGTVQGFLEVLGKPYVGCDCLSSALCMDKEITKQVVQAAGVRVLPSLAVRESQWREEPEQVRENVELELAYPVFIKPLHLGSSVGVSRVACADELYEGMEVAFRYDRELLIEQEVKGRQLEFAVLGHEGEVPWPGEILNAGAFYHYEAKYGALPMKVAGKAEVSAEVAEEGMKLAGIVYRALKCSGMARVDFFLDEENTYWLNEVNPIPGCTPNSLFPKVWEEQGLKGQELVNRLVSAGIRRWGNRESKVITYVA